MTTADHGPTDQTELHCARCAVALERGRAPFHLVEIRSVGDPSPPVFTQEDLEADTRRAIAELLARLARLSERQLIDQVYRRLLHCLCATCYAEWSDDPFGRSSR